ncbi:MAG TPA: bifunctional phosphopantothenoylcysteine decarboxylase/phosphopantothenate--cysteine ligase CoaBC [Desulfuromonadales bacterium]|nr:bifunctional phosphopantothenoylcysteine decarboxylase/phosphopantothenate--cysteine ligase CoaBC [Desulfuromonadales bacterium]
MLTNKKIILGVCGGIAAYKAIELLRLLTKAGADVHVIMTRAAQEFVTPLTFQTLSSNPVHTELFNLIAEREIGHISLADQADLFMIVPATANVIGKIAAGIADDMLTTTVMATKAPVLFAPAMNVNMFTNRIYQENEQKLRQLGYLFVDPIRGSLACGWQGEGKLASPESIFEGACAALTAKDLPGRTILITAGPTREEIDPVRYISNHSSGKMGYALARAACRRGANVLLISGPTALTEPDGVRVVNVTSASEMHHEVMAHVGECDVIIKAAAVADYRPLVRNATKIKKKSDSVTIELAKNPDILAELGKIHHRPFLVGFAAETDALAANAEKKLREKNLDMIVANDVSLADAGFNVDTNRALLLFRDGSSSDCGLMSKEQLAGAILDHVAARLKIH